jgi:hypothetical protein
MERAADACAKRHLNSSLTRDTIARTMCLGRHALSASTTGENNQPHFRHTHGETRQPLHTRCRTEASDTDMSDNLYADLKSVRERRSSLKSFRIPAYSDSTQGRLCPPNLIDIARSDTVPSTQTLVLANMQYDAASVWVSIAEL